MFELEISQLILAGILGIISLLLSIILSKKISKSEGTLVSKILSVILLSLNLCLSMFVLTNAIKQIIMKSELSKIILIPFIAFGFYIILSLSILIGIRLVWKNKNSTEGERRFKGSLNLVLGLLLVVILSLLFYGKIVTKLAESTNNPSFCYMQIDLLNYNFGSSTRTKDSCIINLAYSNPAYCNQAENPSGCIENVAGKKEDANICYLQYQEGGYLLENCLKFAAHKKSLKSQCQDDKCFLQLAQETKNVPFCKDIKIGENKVACIQEIAKEKNNEQICWTFLNSRQEQDSGSLEKCLKEFSGNS